MSQPDRPQGGPQPMPPGLKTLRCSCCGKPRKQIRSLVCGPTPDVAICDECVDLCSEIMRERLAGPALDDHPA